MHVHCEVASLSGSQHSDQKLYEASQRKKPKKPTNFLLLFLSLYPTPLTLSSLGTHPGSRGCSGKAEHTNMSTGPRSSPMSAQ